MINDTVCAGIVDSGMRSCIAPTADDRIPVSMLSDKRSKPVEPEPLTRRDAPALTTDQPNHPNRRRHDPERSHTKHGRWFRPYARLVENAGTLLRRRCDRRARPIAGAADFR